MRSSTTSDLKFLLFAALIFVAVSVALAASWPKAKLAAAAQASKLVGEAAAAPAPEAMTYYQLATKLDPSSAAAYIGLAGSRLAMGRPEAALASLDEAGGKAGEGTEVTRLRIRALLELGRAPEAAKYSVAFTTAGAKEADIVLAAIAYAQAGRHDEIAALKALVSSPEATQALSRVEAGDLPLAAEAFASGLPVSSRALLVKLPESFERNYLLAQIDYSFHTPADLSTANSYLAKAISLKPSDIPARQLYAAILTDQGLSGDAQAQKKLAEQLQNGKP